MTQERNESALDGIQQSLKEATDLNLLYLYSEHKPDPSGTCIPARTGLDEQVAIEQKFPQEKRHFTDPQNILKELGEIGKTDCVNLDTVFDLKASKMAEGLSKLGVAIENGNFSPAERKTLFGSFMQNARSARAEFNDINKKLENTPFALELAPNQDGERLVNAHFKLVDKVKHKELTNWMNPTKLR